jgi:hypothetical protein
VGFDCVDQGYRFAVAASNLRPSRLSESIHFGLLNDQRRASIVEKGVETVKLDSSWPRKGFERTDWMRKRSRLIGVGERGYSTESEGSGFGV